MLIFATGSGQVPPLGYDRSPEIHLINEYLPTSNTCAAVLRLPTAHVTYEKFKEAMDMAILNSPCFDLA